MAVSAASVGSLRPEQKQQLREEGYVLLPGAVPRELVETALGAINHSLGSEGMAKDALPGFRARTFTPELVTAPAILDLYGKSELVAAAGEAIGSVKPPRRDRSP